MSGDADLAKVGSLFGDPTRARVLLALADGRTLPASILAMEAGVAASTASDHLSKLCEGGLLEMQRYGRHRYYRLAGPEVAGAVEALARIAPSKPVRSLREGTRAHALRYGRTCYDHLAGWLGVELMGALLRRGALVGHNGDFDPGGSGSDRPAAPGGDYSYELTDSGRALIADLEIGVPGGRRPLIRYCVDWSEQRHHLAGSLGAALLSRFFELDWLRRSSKTRAVELTEKGSSGFAWLGLSNVDAPRPSSAAAAPPNRSLRRLEPGQSHIAATARLSARAR